MDADEKLFIDIIHQALEAAKDADTETLGLQVKGANTREDFEAFMTRFFEQAGEVPLLSENRFKIVMLVGGQRSWRKARDLVMLALAAFDRSHEDHGQELWPSRRDR
ncbi:MAG: hypothetical protein KKB20_07450 [Proteobacteria bacterium]|nr:hypothetical protein [Pseudomonadota bacterium]